MSHPYAQDLRHCFPAQSGPHPLSHDAFAATCAALKPHLDEGEGSLGIGINVSHLAATPPGMMVTVTVTCTRVEAKRASWQVSARDEIDLIGEGTHDRAIVRWDRFIPKIAEKAALIS